eukprot:2588905-Prymnesium_polylepis.2
MSYAPAWSMNACHCPGPMSDCTTSPSASCRGMVRTVNVNGQYLLQSARLGARKASCTQGCTRNPSRHCTPNMSCWTGRPHGATSWPLAPVEKP